MTSEHVWRRRPPVVGAVRLGWAALPLATPQRVLAILGGPQTGAAVTVARILGVRHAVQSLVEITTWPRWRRHGRHGGRSPQSQRRWPRCD